MSDVDPASADVFDVDRIRRLIELMKEHELSEVDLRQSRQRIRLCRGGGAPVPGSFAMPPYYPTAAPVAPPATSAAPAASSPGAPPAATEDDSQYTIIRSPMVGTFYDKPNPKSENFVKVGSLITPETTICIIEAMKVFNEIPAEIRGRVVEVLVPNEEPVDFGRPLFKIDTRG